MFALDEKFSMQKKKKADLKYEIVLLIMFEI
jgi:hypothetical protein